MSLLQLDTRMVVQLLLSSCSLHSECECWWVSLWVDGNLCKNKCWRLVLADVHDADTSAEGLEAPPGLICLLRTCGSPFKLSSSHVSLTGQHTYPLPALAVQGCCRHLAVVLSPTLKGTLQAERNDTACNQCLVTCLTKQIFFFLPEFDGLLVAANCIFSDTSSAVNRLSNSAELVFIIPNVSVAAICMFAAGVSARWLGYHWWW